MLIYVRKEIRGGWAARSEYPLGDNRVLVVNTCKGMGCIYTMATAHTRDAHGYLTHMLFGDFKKRVLTLNGGLRSTENVIRSTHAQATAMIESVLDEAREFYAKKEVAA